MGTQRVHMKGSGLGWLRWAGRAGTFCPASAALVGPAQNIFSLAVHYINSFVPIAPQAGQAVVLGRLSINMCLSLGESITYLCVHSRMGSLTRESTSTSFSMHRFPTSKTIQIFFQFQHFFDDFFHVPEASSKNASEKSIPPCT